ncbi:hypothetical protein TNCV_4976381 [Trichonephila clavipes]|nr:hypothetical protein TNCV_4976381 [Trichonephila clavipes]
MALSGSLPQINLGVQGVTQEGNSDHVFIKYPSSTEEEEWPTEIVDYLSGKLVVVLDETKQLTTDVSAATGAKKEGCGWQNGMKLSLLTSDASVCNTTMVGFESGDNVERGC